MTSIIVTAQRWESKLVAAGSSSTATTHDTGPPPSDARQQVIDYLTRLTQMSDHCDRDHHHPSYPTGTVRQTSKGCDTRRH